MSALTRSAMTIALQNSMRMFCIVAILSAMILPKDLADSLDKLTLDTIYSLTDDIKWHRERLTQNIVKLVVETNENGPLPSHVLTMQSILWDYQNLRYCQRRKQKMLRTNLIIRRFIAFRLVSSIMQVRL